MSKFILKRRGGSMSTRHNPYKPRGQWKYDPWQTVGRFDTVQEAQRALLSVGTGLFDRAVFYRGRRVVDNTGRIRQFEIDRADRQAAAKAAPAPAPAADDGERSVDDILAAWRRL